jgi:hypothetical protein
MLGMPPMSMPFWIKRRTERELLIDIFDEICDRGLAERLVENRYTEFVEDRGVSGRYGLTRNTSSLLSPPASSHALVERS